MRLGVIGKGRLGSAIAQAVREDARSGFEILWQVGREGPPKGTTVDCAIDAGNGPGVADHVRWALETQTQLVIGATGFGPSDIPARAGQRIGIVVAPNLSLTVALYAAFVRVLGRFAAQDEGRDPYVVEHHHARKLDAPGGTARMLAGLLIESCPRKTGWTVPHAGSGPLLPNQLNVSAIRAGHTYSTHTVGVDAPGEVIELHHASRDASAYGRGALTAARWIQGRQGIFGMDQVARDALAPLFEGIPG